MSVEKPGHQGVWCSKCGYEFTSEPQGEPCPGCGYTRRTYGVLSSTTATGTASSTRTVGKNLSTTAKGRARYRAKARSGEAGKPGGKPWLTLKSGPSWSYSSQKWMHREKTENRRDNRYTEVVKDPDTGEIVYEVDEPLTDHWGHGSARRKKAAPRE
jgi:hypothetical protein